MAQCCYDVHLELCLECRHCRTTLQRRSLHLPSCLRVGIESQDCRFSFMGVGVDCNPFFGTVHRFCLGAILKLDLSVAMFYAQMWCRIPFQCPASRSKKIQFASFASMLLWQAPRFISDSRLIRSFCVPKTVGLVKWLTQLSAQPLNPFWLQLVALRRQRKMTMTRTRRSCGPSVKESPGSSMMDGCVA